MALLDRLHELRTHVRRLLWLSGGSWVVACLFGVLLVVGAVDWLVGLDDRWLRFGALIATCGFVGNIAWRALIVPLREPLTSVEVAGHLERQFPQLRGQLATAVEFAEQGVNPRVGSVELQQRLIEQTSQQVASLDFPQTLDRRPATRALLLAGAVLGLAGVTVLTHPAEAGIALSRLLWPFGDQRWPQRVELQLVDGNLKPIPSDERTQLKRVQGQPLELFAVNVRGSLPNDVAVEYRKPDDAPHLEPLRTATLRDPDGRPREAAAIRLPVMEGLVEFRVIGGDDRDMAWRALEIVPPPKIEAFDLRVTSPAYSHEPSVFTRDAGAQVRALLGSQLEITARTNRSIREARWTDHATAPNSEAATSSPRVQVSSDGRSVRIQQTVTQVGSSIQRLVVVDRDGFENESAMRLEVVGLADPAPTVTLLEPASDRLVTPQATVLVQAHVTDDRALKDVDLELLTERSSHADETSAEAPTPPAKSDDNAAAWQRQLLWNAAAAVTEPKESAKSPVQRELAVRHELSLTEWSLAPGDRVRLRVAASDFCDVGPPRVAHSAVRTLMVVTADAKRAEIANRLGLLLHDLEDLIPRQTQTRNQIDELRVQLEKANELRAQDRDALKRVDFDQRQLDLRLVGKGDGVAARAAALLDELAVNHLSADSSHARLSEVVQTVEVLARQTLPPLENTLGQLTKNGATRTPTANDFSDVAARQTEILSSLQTLVRDLAQWHDRRELAREIGDLLDSQTELTRDTNALAPQTLGKTTSQLTGQQQADLAKLADRQARQAERIEQLRERLNDAAKEPADNITASRAAREVAADLDQKGTAETARQAARQIGENNLGQAGELQQKLANDLQTLVEKLDEPAVSSPDEAVRELRQLETQLDELQQQQKKLLDETRQVATDEQQTPEEAADRAKSLAERQTSLENRSQELASRLKNQNAEQSAEPLRRAIRHMRQAEQQLANKQFAAGANEQQEALDDLEQSRRELADARRAAEQEQLTSKTNELAAAVQELVAQQQTVIAETDTLATEQQKAGKWTRPLAKAALSLADAENALHGTTRELAEALHEVAAMRLVLDRAAQHLSAAASRLKDKQLDAETQSHEQAALRALQSLANALTSTPMPSEKTPPQDQEQNVTGERREAPQDPVPPVAQLQLLRQLQSELRDATQAADKLNGESPEELKRRTAIVEQLAREQSEVELATQQLLDRFPPPEPTTPPENAAEDETVPRAKSLRAMHDAQQQLAARETSDKTQNRQQVAIEQLKALESLWQQRAQKQQGMSRATPSPSQKPEDKDSQTTDEGSGGKARGRDKPLARDSSQRENTGADREAALGRERQLREAIWGHLPPALREKMLNLPHDKTLPKYSEHIRRYYEALAEQP